MSDCFWDQESVVGLSKVCTAAAPVGDVLSFIPSIDEWGGGGYKGVDGSSFGLFKIAQWSPYFGTALEGAAFAGTITGISFIRELDGSGPGSLGSLGTPLPSGVVFDSVTWEFPLTGGGVYNGLWGAFARDGDSGKYYYGRVVVGGETFYGLFAVGGGM